MLQNYNNSPRCDDPCRFHTQVFSPGCEELCDGHFHISSDCENDGGLEMSRQGSGHGNSAASDAPGGRDGDESVLVEDLVDPFPHDALVASPIGGLAHDLGGIQLLI